MLRSAIRYAALIALVAGLVSLAFAAGFSTAVRTQSASAASAPRPEVADQFKVFWEAWRVVERDFVDRSKVEPKKMTYGAIKGALDSLGDPYTAHIDATHFRFEQSELGGAFYGIGATVSVQDGRIVIVSPIDGSPAARAGLRPGTRILAIDGEDTASLSLTEAVEKIRGPKGTTVRLTVLQPGESVPITVELQREEIRTPSVTAQLIEPDVGYVKIAQFTARTADELARALKRVKGDGAKRYILDLRRNPGGLLQAAVDVASQFISEGVVVYSVNAEGKRTPYDVSKGRETAVGPLVVLIDKGSASASEVVSGALHDRQRAKLVGEQTFGKGTVTQMHPLSDGSAVNVSVARWLTPGGQQIEGIGLAPDTVVPFPEEDRNAGRDPQLARAIDVVRNE